MEEEDQSSQINGDELYETIEAPKFVDFTTPDHSHPGDRYWFCLRVGCDQKHEEEMDSEAIYKNFVLRVMAARSPNIRLQKALNSRKPQSMKCPLTAPPESSKSRLSRLALISSISKKIFDVKDRDRRPISKISTTPKPNSKQSYAATAKALPESSKSRLSRLALISSISKKIFDVKDRDRRPISKISTTPKPNSKQSYAATAKALTTPRNRKQISNPDTFRSVRSPKDLNIAVPKNKLIAKALVFNSPKKAVKVGKISAAMKKLEINVDKKHHMEHNKPLHLHSTVKQKRGREVESRVFDSFHPRIKKELEITGDKKHLMEHNMPLPLHSTVKQKRVREVKSRVFDSLKRKNKEKDLNSCGPEAHEWIDTNTNDTKIEERSKCGSLEECSALSLSKNGNKECLKATRIEHPDEVLSKSSREPGDRDPKFQATVGPLKNTNGSADDNEEKVKYSSKDISNSEDMAHDDKENALVFGAEGNGQVIDSDDKENASASDDNRELKEGKDLSNHDTPKKPLQQVNRVTHKTLKKSSASTSTGPQYRKPTTNPKPFRLRTDERSILKEANLEKKLQTPLKEITSAGLQGGKSMKKHQSAIHERSILKEANLEKKLQTHLKEITPAGLQGGKSMKKHQSAIHKNENCLKQNEYETCTVTTLQTCSVSMKHKASLVNSIKEECQFKVVKKCEDGLEKTKSPLMQKKLARPQGCSSRKAVISNKKHGQLSVLKETCSTILRTKEAAKMCKSDASRTNPKEPNFHNIHVRRTQGQ